MLQLKNIVAFMCFDNKLRVPENMSKLSLNPTLSSIFDGVFGIIN